MKGFVAVAKHGALAVLIGLSVAATPRAASSSDKFDLEMEPVLDAYLAVQATLAADSLDGVSVSAKKIAEAGARLTASSASPEHAEHYAGLPAKIVVAANDLSKAGTLDSARDAFKDLSRPLAMWASMSAPADVVLVYCPMAQASWLQKNGSIRNPYFGSSMLSCGELVPASRRGDGRNDAAPQPPRETTHGAHRH